MPNRENTILVVDDTDANRYAVARHLRQAGFNILEAATGREALSLAERQPALIILDVKLPDILGYDVCRELKRNARTRSIPVLHISATFQMSSDRIKGLDSGADGFLTGPVEPEELLANVKVLLRLHETTESLRQSNERLAGVLSSMTDAFFAVNDQGRLTEMNAVAEEKIFRRPRSAVLGQRLDDQSELGEFWQKCAKAAEQNRPLHFEAVIRDKWFEVHAYPARDQLDVYGRDITERKQAEQALLQARDDLTVINASLEKTVQERTAELRELIEELEHFSYTIAHDMRAPLRAMQGFGELLMEEDCGCAEIDRRDLIRRIQAAAGRMDRLITDALNFTLALRQQLVLAPVDISALLAGMLESYPQFQIPNATIHLRPDIPYVMGNESAIVQCFSNLLNNALKFVRPGQVPEVWIWGEVRDEFVRVWVQDNGIGIPKDAQKRIFGLFERLDPAKDGTGIGLALVQKVVRRMGGRIGVESDVDQGSRFWIELKSVNEPPTP